MSRTLMLLTRMMSAVAVLTFLAGIGHAQFDLEVISETFDSRTDTTGIGLSDGPGVIALVDQGGGDNALQLTATSGGNGFFVAGFTISDLEVEPGPGGPNTSTNLAAYQLSFDVDVNAIDGFLPNLEIWLADGPRFAANSANLYSAGGLVDGTQSISFTLENPVTTTPNGFPTGTWSPTADDWWIQVNAISFSAVAGVSSFDYTIDNIRVGTVPEPASLLLFALAAPAAWCFVRRRRSRG